VKAANIGGNAKYAVFGPPGVQIRFDIENGLENKPNSPENTT
jgi:hypothetical protein